MPKTRFVSSQWLCWILERGTPTIAAPTPAPTSTTSPDPPQSDDEADDGIRYVVECETDCNELCFQVEGTEAINLDRAICTAKGSLRSESCAKCDKPPSVAVEESSSSMLLMFVVTGMALF